MKSDVDWLRNMSRDVEHPIAAADAHDARVHAGGEQGGHYQLEQLPGTAHLPSLRQAPQWRHYRGLLHTHLL